MFISIPSTRWTRDIDISFGRNAAGNPSFAVTTCDNTDLFIFAAYFESWCTPGVIYYNDVRPFASRLLYHKAPRPLFKGVRRTVSRTINTTDA